MLDSMSEEDLEETKALRTLYRDGTDYMAGEIARKVVLEALDLDQSLLEEAEVRVYATQVYERKGYLYTNEMGNDQSNYSDEGYYLSLEVYVPEWMKEGLEGETAWEAAMYGLEEKADRDAERAAEAKRKRREELLAEQSRIAEELKALGG